MPLVFSNHYENGYNKNSFFYKNNLNSNLFSKVQQNKNIHDGLNQKQIKIN
jgi:hypothetical protein